MFWSSRIRKWLRSKWKEAGNRKELGAGLINQTSFYVKTPEDVAERIRMTLKYVPAGKTLNQSLPTNVDMTRRYSILSPPEFDRGEGAWET
jgi:methionine synthase II (cobalamin-independent)